MQFFEQENVITSISENNSLIFYEIREEENENDGIFKLWTKEYKQTILYDLILLTKDQNSSYKIFLFYILTYNNNFSFKKTIIFVKKRSPSNSNIIYMSVFVSR